MDDPSLLVVPPAKWPAWFHYGKNTPTCQMQRVLRGLHPLGARLLANNDGAKRCGNCAHHVTHEYANVYHKCDALRQTSAPATDLRLKWWACELWREK